VQIGAFKDRQNALSLKERLQKEYPKIEITETIQFEKLFPGKSISRLKSLRKLFVCRINWKKKGFFQTLVVAGLNQEICLKLLLKKKTGPCL